MLSFFLYQAYGISVGRTTYETLKRNQLLKDSAAAAAATKLQDSSRHIGDGTNIDGDVQDVGTALKEAGSGQQPNGSSSSRQAASNSAAAAAGGGAADTSGTWRSKLSIWWRQQQQQQQQFFNYYDRGFWGNWCEVLWPDAFLQQYRQQLAAHSKDE
jgi:hypothetical protein